MPGRQGSDPDGKIAVVNAAQLSKTILNWQRVSSNLKMRCDVASYTKIRRELLSVNRYFQADVERIRQTLGIPKEGFAQPVSGLDHGIKRNGIGIPVGKPNLKDLTKRAERLGLPLQARIQDWSVFYSERGHDFNEVVDELGWGAVPVFSPFGWAGWWVNRERHVAGLGRHLEEPKISPPIQNISPPDSRLPSVRAALDLASRYQLGEGFVDSILDIILGAGRGGGEADVIIVPSRDGLGQQVTITSIPYDITLSAWQAIYYDCIQPIRLSDGPFPEDVPIADSIREARKRMRPGRPPYSSKTLSTHLQMWGFCFEKDYLQGGLGTGVMDDFLSNLPEGERTQFESMDQESFRKAVRKLDRMFRPTRSATDFFP